jgi:C4-dicarboxylate-specific signal transduction histidine kinase
VTQLRPGLPPIEGDAIQLQQVMLNLIMNAGEAMAGTRGRDHTLRVRTLSAAGQVHITFTDNGPGFPAEAYEKLFEPFFTTKPQGLGLGLSISRTIIVAHRGKLWGVSRPGSGASFHISLPART